MVVAFTAIFILPDFPATTRWLTPLERSLALRRMAEDGSLHVEDEEGTNVSLTDIRDDNISASTNGANLQGLAYHIHGFYLAIRDWKVWWLAVALAADVAALSFFQFVPTLTATMGFSRTVTLILVAPPWFVSALAAWTNAR